MAVDPESTPENTGTPEGESADAPAEELSGVHPAHPRWHASRSPLLRALRSRRFRRWTAVLVVAVIGASLGLVLGASVQHRVGPVEATFRLRLSTNGGTRVNVPPLGNIQVHDHAGPLKLRISVDQVDVDQVRRLISSTESADAIGKRLQDDVKSAVVRLAIRSGVCAVAGAALLTIVVFRRPTYGLVAGGLSIVMLAVSGGIAALTYRTAALSEPKFSGILASAPAAIGDVQDIAARFTAYRAELARLVTNVSKLYDVASTLPDAAPSADTTAVLWVSDIHDNPEAFSVMTSLIAQFHVATVVDSGDLSDHGTDAENQLYAPIRTLGVPYVYVKGNHDSENHTVATLRTMKNVTVLDDTEATVAGIRFAGIGDPRFTPNKTAQASSGDETKTLNAYGQQLAQTLTAHAADVAVIHDPAMGNALFGHVPLILSGHLHRRGTDTSNGTLELTQGSTGGAGLRNLEGADPLPLDASVLYFDTTTHKLIAYDDVTVGGLGLTSVQIQRHAVDSVIKGGTNPVPPSVPPSVPASFPPPSRASASASGPASGSAGASSSGTASGTAPAGTPVGLTPSP